MLDFELLRALVAVVDCGRFAKLFRTVLWSP
jgi:hypothetical protein